MQPTAAYDMSKVTCYRCQKTGHFRSDCPKEQNSSKSSAESSKKKKKKYWREVAPASGISTTVTKNEKTYNWCTKCRKGKGHWTINHTNDTHLSQHPNATTDATPAAASTLMELSDGGFYCN